MHWLPYRVSKAHRSSVYPSSEHSHNGLTFETSDSEPLYRGQIKVQLIESKYPIQRVYGSQVERQITESKGLRLDSS